MAWLITASFALVAAGAILPLWTIRARKRALEGAQASARAAVERLAFCVETVPPRDDPIAAQLLSDATGRWHTAGALLAQAGTPGECRVAEDVAHQGLRQVGEACRRLGLPVPSLEERR